MVICSTAIENLCKLFDLNPFHFFLSYLCQCLLEIINLFFGFCQSKLLTFYGKTQCFDTSFLQTSNNACKILKPFTTMNLCFCQVQKLIKQNKVGLIHISHWHSVWPLSPKCFICIQRWKTKWKRAHPFKKFKQYKNTLVNGWFQSKPSNIWLVQFHWNNF